MKRKSENIVVVQQFKSKTEPERQRAYIEKMAKAITLTEQKVKTMS